MHNILLLLPMHNPLHLLAILRLVNLEKYHHHGERKHKAPMIGAIDTHMERLSIGFHLVVDAINSDNTLIEKLSNVAERQVTIA